MTPAEWLMTYGLVYLEVVSLGGIVVLGIILLLRLLSLSLSLSPSLAGVDRFVK